MNRSRGPALVALIVLLLPSTAYAHSDLAVKGFVSGLLHPVLGLDHFLAMLSVGIVSAQMGGKRVLIVPAMFVLAMIAGAVAGVQGHLWPFTEQGIALSVIVLGVAIATMQPHFSSWPVLVVVAFFGSLHGHAHGLELPKSADPIYYAAGFVTSTATIHLIGVGIGHVFTRRTKFEVLLRHIGSGMAGIGLLMLTKMGSG